MRDREIDYNYPNYPICHDDGYGMESRPYWTVVEGSLRWQEYSKIWWDEHLLSEIMDGPRTLLAFTGTEWPIRLTISTREVDQESGQLIRWVEILKFHPAAILEELFAQQEDILHSAVAVKEALRARVEYHDNQSSDLRPVLLNLHKQGIDDIYVLLKLHYVAARITGELIDFLQREILLHGGSILQDFRHYSFEGYPLSYEDEFLYYQAVKAFGIAGLKWIGSPAFHLPPNPDGASYTPINPDDGRRPCYVLDRCPLSGMLLFFPEEEEEDRRYVWENDDSRVELGFRAARGRELIAANPRLVGSVWEEPVALPEQAVEDPSTRYLRF